MQARAVPSVKTRIAGLRDIVPLPSKGRFLMLLETLRVTREHAASVGVEFDNCAESVCERLGKIQQLD